MTGAPQQLDIFAHSRGVALRNEVQQALEQHDAVAARAAWHALAAEFNDDAALPALDELTRALECVDNSPLSDHAAAAAECARLAQPLSAAAELGLGAQAAERWLRPRWAALAARCAHLPFDAAQANTHAAALFLRAQDWPSAAQAVERIESWRRVPAPLGWMVHARYRMEGLDAAWPLLAELAWLAPARLHALLAQLEDALLGRLQRRFDAEFDGDGAGPGSDLAWFPAWVLTQTPALAPHLARAQRGQQGDAERGMRSMVELLGLERQGRHHELVQRRRALRDLHGSLYKAYMATR
jgi:hypothetical protein